MSRIPRQNLQFEAVAADSANRGEALALSCADVDPARRASHLAQVRAAATDGTIDGLWAAYRGERIVGAVRAAALPGKTALVSAARIVAGEPAETARQLLAAAVEALPGRGARLAHALTETDHGADAELLVACGFRHVGDVLQLVSHANGFAEDPPATELDFVPYQVAPPGQLAQIVARTYAGSLDFPAVDGVRSVDDVLEGYREGCDFDPALWLIVRRGGMPVGCLLISPDERLAQWELTYMGVVPEARGRELGLSIVRHAQWLARKRGCGRMTLGVDAANLPAQRAYAAAGFTTWDRRSVFLRVF